MGRKRMYPVETEMEKMSHLKRNPVTLKNRHRFADSKYRHNVQFFFDILRETFNNKASKDDLLESISEDLFDMENSINLSVGPLKLAEYKQDFLKLVELEENIWKKEKIPLIWWTKMQEALNDVNDVLDVRNYSSLDFSSAILKHSLNNGTTSKKESSRKTLPIIKPKSYARKSNALNSNTGAATSEQIKNASSNEITKSLKINKKAGLTSNCNSKKLANKKNSVMNSDLEFKHTPQDYQVEKIIN